MEKFKNIFYKAMIVVLLIMSSIATIGALCNFYQTSSVRLSPFIIVLGVGVLIFFFIGIYSLIKKINDKYINIITAILCISFFMALCIFGNKFSIIPSYDLSHIQRELMLMIENGKEITNVGYFAKYANQVPLTIILYYVYRLGTLLHFGNLKMFAIIINSLFIMITALFTYLSVKKLSNKRYALMTLLFFVINPIFYMYASYFYTDTLCMPFAAIAIYLFIISKDRKKIGSVLSLLLSGFLLAVGFKIRVVVAILLIGIILTLWLNNEKLKSIVKTSACLVVGFMIGIVSYNLITLDFKIPKDDTLEFPVYHWVMMGLNDERTGRYNENDHTYTKSQSTYEEKKKADLKLIKERIKDLGLFGHISLFARKININWSNGAYRYLDKMANVDEFSVGYEYIGGNNIIFTLYAMQICKGLVLVLFTYLVFLELTNKKNKDIRFIIVSLFGAFLFYSLWEVQARYSLSFLPWLMILFPFGIKSVEDNIINKEFFQIKFKRVVSFFVIILTVLLLGFNFYKYAIKESYYYDTRVNQVKTRSTVVTNLSDKVVEQSFKTDRKFNNISLKFIKKDINTLSSYQFTLYDKDKSVLYQEIFTSDDVEDNKFKSFSFDSIELDKEEEYIISVAALDESEDTIGLESYAYVPYKVYSKGNLLVNGEDTGASLTFKVQEKIKRSYTSITSYVIMSVIILLIEIVAFYPYIKKQK